MDLTHLRHFKLALLPLLTSPEEKFNLQTLRPLLRKYFSPQDTKKIEALIREDLVFFKQNDPASQNYSLDEILSVRRGMIAVAMHRVMNKILDQKRDQKSILFEIECLAKEVQKITNVEIHPQAKIGKNFAIDHGHGTVIGATSIIGDNVFCYHGVTLGASGKKSKNKRRHPKLGNNIFLGNGCQILGPATLENNIRVSSNAMVINAYIESNASISPGVVINRVLVPSGTKIFGFIPEEQKFWGQLKDKNTPEKIKLPSFDVETMKN